MKNNKYSLVLLSGGTGTRMNNNIPKQYMILAGKPIIMHTLERVDKIKKIDEIIIVCKDEYKSNIIDYIKNYHLNNDCKVVSSGNTRQASVYNGICYAKNENIIIHEAARPFVKIEEFLELINYDNDNVTYGSPINYTVLTQKDNIISGTLRRDELVNIQLPQKFNKSLLIDCHKKAIDDNLIFTEDASLIFHYTKENISVIRGKDYNLKITTPEDMIIGEKIYKEYFVRR